MGTNQIKMHPDTNGGRTMKHALDLLVQNPKNNRFLAMTILKGLGLKVDFISISKLKAEEGIELKGGLQYTFIKVYLD